MIPLFSRVGTAAEPFGMPMGQNRLAIPTWSYAMEVLPPARIIELGSWNGAFITMLAVHAWNLSPRAKVVTYDRHSGIDERIRPLSNFLGVEYRGRQDLFQCEKEIADLIQQPGITYLLCDNGDKPRELMTFAPYLKPGDVIGAHDYNLALEHPDRVNLSLLPEGETAYWAWSETREADGERAAAANDLEPWRQDDFDVAAWLVYRKRQRP